MFMLGAVGWRNFSRGATGALLGYVCLAGSAHAQTGSDPATARALFAEARKLMSEKRYAEACPKFEESNRLDTGIGAMYNLADCWERSGRTASAWGMFLDTAATARAAGQNDRVKVAKERAAQLEPKLSRMTIRVASAEPGLEVKRDGQVVAPASYDTAVPVDPGAHHIEVAATGKKPYTTSVDVAASANVSVQIPKLENADAVPAAAVAPLAATDASPSTAPAGATPDVGPNAHRSRALPYTLAGVGVVGLVVGTVFELKSRGQNDDALKICPSGAACAQTDIDRHEGLVSDAKTDQLVAIVGAGVGAAALITAVVLIATEPPRTNAQAKASFSLDFGAGTRGGVLFAKGSF